MVMIGTFGDVISMRGAAEALQDGAGPGGLRPDALAGVPANRLSILIHHLPSAVHPSSFIDAGKFHPQDTDI